MVFLSVTVLLLVVKLLHLMCCATDFVCDAVNFCFVFVFVFLPCHIDEIFHLACVSVVPTEVRLHFLKLPGPQLKYEKCSGF